MEEEEESHRAAVPASATWWWTRPAKARGVEGGGMAKALRRRAAARGVSAPRAGTPMVKRTQSFELNTAAAARRHIVSASSRRRSSGSRTTHSR